MKLEGKVAFDEGGHIGGPSTVQTAGRKNVCVSRRERGLLRNNFDDGRSYRQTRVLLASTL
jgi:hypothetical protein